MITKGMTALFGAVIPELVKEVVDFFDKRAAACCSALALLARLQAEKCFSRRRCVKNSPVDCF